MLKVFYLIIVTNQIKKDLKNFPKILYHFSCVVVFMYGIVYVVKNILFIKKLPGGATNGITRCGPGHIPCVAGSPGGGKLVYIDFICIAVGLKFFLEC